MLHTLVHAKVLTAVVHNPPRLVPGLSKATQCSSLSLSAEPHSFLQQPNMPCCSCIAVTTQTMQY